MLGRAAQQRQPLQQCQVNAIGQGQAASQQQVNPSACRQVEGTTQTEPTVMTEQATSIDAGNPVPELREAATNTVSRVVQIAAPPSEVTMEARPTVDGRPVRSTGYRPVGTQQTLSRSQIKMGAAAIIRRSLPKRNVAYTPMHAPEDEVIELYTPRGSFDLCSSTPHPGGQPPTEMPEYDPNGGRTTPIAP